MHEDLIFSLIPLHAGMRQYWRDLETEPLVADPVEPEDVYYR
jgi:hypothetical protein